MPRLTSLTSRSLLNIGIHGGSLTFDTPGTYYWTAPAGITKVDITGQGGSSVTVNAWSSDAEVFTLMWRADSTTTLPTTVGSSLTYEDLEATMASLASDANSITTVVEGAYYTFTNREIFYKNNGTWYTQTYQQWNDKKLRRTGTFDTSYNYGTGEVNDTGYQNRYLTGGGDIEYYGPSTTFGTDTTAFGQTFADNEAQSTVTEVTVTAGTQYTIVVGTDEGTDTAFLSFDYY